MNLARLANRLPVPGPFAGRGQRAGGVALFAFASLVVALLGPVAAQNVDAADPSNLQLEVQASGIALSWDAPSESADTVSGYRIWRNGRTKASPARPCSSTTPARPIRAT